MKDRDDDAFLLQEVSRGEEGALVRLMEKHKEPVFRFTYRYLGNASDSEEVTEETFFRVFKNAQRYRPGALVKTWIFSIALNLSRDRLRKRKKSRGEFSIDQAASAANSENPLIERIDSGARSPDVQSQTLDELRVIRRCIEELPEKIRFPFVFCVLEEHSYDECAAILRSTRKVVETRIYRARKMLRSQLANIREKV